MKNFMWVLACTILLLVRQTNGKISFEVVIRLMQKLTSDCVSGAYKTTSAKGCPVNFDRYLSCWPPALPNTTVAVRCAYVLYKEGYSTRRCNENGTWEHPNTRQECQFLSSEQIRSRRNELILKMFDDTKAIEKYIEQEYHDELHYSHLRNLAFYLRCIDLFVCIVSLMLITWVVPWKDRRFILHRFLILSFAMYDGLRILTNFSYYSFNGQYECTIEWIFAQYFITVQVFMMFCEGFYQFRQFYYVFVAESRVQSYVLFAYVTPMFLVFGAYVPAFYFDPPNANKPMIVCWQFYDAYKYNYFIYAPIFVLLLLNLLITIYMMNLIITKLKREKSQNATKARKGARGFLVLVVLLGFGYMVTLYGPSTWWFRYFKNIIQPTQGMLVCLLQVFFSHQIINGCRKGKRKFVSSKRVEKSFNQSKMKRSSVSQANSFYGLNKIPSQSKQKSQVNSIRHDDENKPVQSHSKQNNDRIEVKTQEGKPPLEDNKEIKISITTDKNIDLPNDTDAERHVNSVVVVPVSGNDEEIFYTPYHANEAFDLDEFQEFTSYNIQGQEKQRDPVDVESETCDNNRKISQENNVSDISLAQNTVKETEEEEVHS